MTFRPWCASAALFGLTVAASPAWAAPGDLDPTFAGGVTQVDVASEVQSAEAMAVGPDGSVFVVGSTQNGIVREIVVAKFTSTGLPDLAFGSDGVVHTPVGDDAIAYGVAVQGDGMVVVVGRTGDLLGASDVVVVRYEADGDLDTTFGGGDGIVTFDLAGNVDEAHGVLVEPGGAIVVVGFGTDGSFKDDMLVLRYETDGDPDPTFGGGDGIVTATFTNGAKAFAVARRTSDGALVVGGRTTLFDDFAVAVLDSGGTPEADFSTDGFVTTDFGKKDGIVALAVQDDEAIVAIGESRSNGSDGVVAIARYETDGDPDATFNLTGTRTADIGANVIVRGGAVVAGGRILSVFQTGTAVGFVAYESDGDQDGTFGSGGFTTENLHAMPAALVRSGGNGGCLVATTLYSGGHNGDLGLFRLHGDGTLDRGFGQHGRLVVPFIPSGFDAANAALVQSDGKIVVAGGDDGSRFLLARFSGDGVPDTTFGLGSGFSVFASGCTPGQYFGLLRLPSNGYVAVGICNTSFAVDQLEEDGDLDLAFGSGGSGFFTTDFDGDGGIAQAVGRQSDGKLVVVGRRGTGDSADFVAVRLTETGELDETFGVAGVATVDFSGRADDARDVVVQPDDSIVLAGFTRLGAVNDFAVAKLLPGGTPDPDFGSGGKVQIDVGGDDDRGFSILRQAGGRLVIAGQAGTLPGLAFGLLGLDQSGTPDPGFGTGGKVTSSFSGDDIGQRVVTLPDGRLLVGGTIDDPSDTPGFGLARYSADGELDGGFGTGGFVQTPFFGADTPLAGLAIAPNGDAVASGALEFSNSGASIVLARYLVSGDGPTTTSTTLPPGAELCGNCLDDDGDGLTDFEDPGCCTAGPMFALKRALAKPVKTATRLQLKGTLGGTVPDPSATGMAVQLRPTGGDELLCARIASAGFTRKGKVAQFVDKPGTLAGAGGIGRIVMKTRKDGSVAFALKGKKTPFATPAAGPVAITLGFGDGTTAGSCATVTPTFRAKKKGTIIAP